MAWNREHGGVAATPAVAIDWSVVAMTEAAGRFSRGGTWSPAHAAAAVGETVWWVTLVDATLVRYYPREYESALAGEPGRQRKIEETLTGLRYVRNQLGQSVEPADFICPDGAAATGWSWRPLPEPGLAALEPRAREWELSRYRAYQARLAGRDIGRAFIRCAVFLGRAASMTSSRVPARF